MENSFFIYTEKGNTIQIERFHICTWEFNNNSSLVEFGFEISKESITNDNLTISLFIPWVEKSCEMKDLYDKLSIADNSRFIFNDSISATKYLKNNTNKSGVIHTFNDRNELCVLPADIKIDEDKIVTATLNIKAYREYNQETKPNLYFRFWVKPSVPFISMRKKGVSKSTIIYDIKVNERRNIPDNKTEYFNDHQFCKIKYCFSFNILPNKYDIVFFDNTSLKNVRTLEYESFNKYLGDKRVKKDELIVVFNKKQDSESYSFFSIYSMERIGTGQFALAILINIFCGVLLFIPAFRKTFVPEISLLKVWTELPSEIFIALGLAITTLIYFILPLIVYNIKKTWSWISTNFGSKK
ncbi:hypothetical protein [Flavobacterium sp. AJR]|uniref:hypothetical protein n=1 Tax=Flavobacterium sp. AJR TaxID=1979369 RepID=UPI000A3D860B|nr:hypothetical protein [Flavobacterium sp. AJR]OUL60979.1 hypothetical protein B8T70_17685 [Flavobacterium sp. AJR]